jgi:hypothetical protein
MIPAIRRKDDSRITRPSLPSNFPTSKASRRFCECWAGHVRPLLRCHRRGEVRLAYCSRRFRNRRDTLLVPHALQTGTTPVHFLLERAVTCIEGGFDTPAFAIRTVF